MLAYVFWHQPRPDVTGDEYETLLGAFHRSLAAAPPPDFHGSAAYRLAAAPWAPPGSVYEDWYLVSGSVGLDRLNDAAVTASRQAPHDSVAARAAWGAAGLYRLREGTGRLPSGGSALWFGKPAGLPYDSFYREVRGTAGLAPWSLWGRQMVLGPTPEFCLHAPSGDLAQPAPRATVAIALEPVWPGARP